MKENSTKMMGRQICRAELFFFPPKCGPVSLLLELQEEIVKNADSPLPGVVQWTKCWSANQKVAGSIPSQGTCLSWGPGPHLGACERQQIDVSLEYQCFSPSLPLSKNK